MGDAILIIAAGKKALDAALLNAEQANSDFQEIKDFINCAEIRTDAESGTVAYVWENIKWYDSFPSIIFIVNFLEGLDQNEYLLIRIGEEYDNVECAGSFWENHSNMGLERVISF